MFATRMNTTSKFGMCLKHPKLLLFLRFWERILPIYWISPHKYYAVSLSYHFSKAYLKFCPQREVSLMSFGLYVFAAPWREKRAITVDCMVVRRYKMGKLVQWQDNNTKTW